MVYLQYKRRMVLSPTPRLSTLNYLQLLAYFAYIYTLLFVHSCFYVDEDAKTVPHLHTGPSSASEVRFGRFRGSIRCCCGSQENAGRRLEQDSRRSRAERFDWAALVILPASSTAGNCDCFQRKWSTVCTYYPSFLNDNAIYRNLLDFFLSRIKLYFDGILFLLISCYFWLFI